MTIQTLFTFIALSEDSNRQVKAILKNAGSLASEMAAFANTNSRTIFIGVMTGITEIIYEATILQGGDT